MQTVARIDLRVPSSDQDQARRLGARWDGLRKTWFIPEGVDPAALAAWLPQPHSPNIRASSWALATSTRPCWRCSRISRVFAIVLPGNYEALYVADDPTEDCWQRGDSPTLLSYLNDVPPEVARELQARAVHYRIDYSFTTHSFYWMNHCEHCEAKLGDFETLQEPGTFFELGEGLDESALRASELVKISLPFTASCGSYADLL